MKRFTFVLLLICYSVGLMYAQTSDVPSSQRSLKAIKEVKPGLEKELNEIGLEWGGAHICQDI